jgi:MFS transporter, DHA1 family, multidrug resistance protein
MNQHSPTEAFRLEAEPIAPPRVPLWLLALFVFSGTLAMHVFVPALPHAAIDLGVSPSAMQMTVSLYILGLAFGQLIYGPVSDRIGRRPTLIVGLLLYTVAGLGAALAPTAHALIFARLFQALGGCSGLVLGRAIVRDTCATQESARRLALLNVLVTAGPGVAPLVGTALADTLGWRFIFFALCGLGLADVLLAWKMLPETSRTASHESVGQLAHNYWKLVCSARFLGFSIGGGCATTSMYAFLAAAPFIFQRDLGRPSGETAVYLALLVSGFCLGSILSSRLIPHMRLSRLMVGANLISVAGALIFLAAVFTDTLNVPVTIVSMFMFCLGAGTAAPASLTQAISVNPLVIGSASGLYGFAQMAVGALCTALAGLGDDPALSAALVLAGAGVVSQIAFAVALRPTRQS